MDPYALDRFVEAQDSVYSRAVGELSAGRKRTHWMWFIFPQLRGLGQSQTARQFGISGRDEAIAYMAHPVLGPRLRECAELVNQMEGRRITQIFDDPDDLKFRSSMTLFSRVTADNQIFEQALRKYFKGEPDEITLHLLAS